MSETYSREIYVTKYVDAVNSNFQLLYFRLGFYLSFVSFWLKSA
jgi:hypothetical protein